VGVASDPCHAESVSANGSSQLFDPFDWQVQDTFYIRRYLRGGALPSTDQMA